MVPPISRSMPGRAERPIALDHRAALADQHPLLRLGLDGDDRVHAPGARAARRQQLVDRHGERVRHLLARERERALADQLGDAEAGGLIGARLLGEVGRPLGQQGEQLVAQRVHPVARDRADRVQRVEVAEPGHLRDALGDPGRRHPVDLVERDHGRPPAVSTRAAMKRSPGPGSLARVEHEQHRVDVGEALVDGALHLLGERVTRSLEARAGRPARAARPGRARRRARAGASSAACPRRSRRGRGRARS